MWLYINLKYILIAHPAFIYIVITDVCNDESKEQKSSMQNKIMFGFF